MLDRYSYILPYLISCMMLIGGGVALGISINALKQKPKDNNPDYFTWFYSLPGGTNPDTAKVVGPNGDTMTCVRDWIPRTRMVGR